MAETKILIATPSSSSIEKIRDDLSVMNRLKIYESNVGIDCLFKMENSIPQILIIEDRLPKSSGKKVIEWVLAQGKEYSKMAIILMTEEPSHSEFQEQMTTGKLQVISSVLNSSEFKLAFVKAYNYSMGAVQKDFRTKYLKKGETLLREGEDAEYVYLLRQGKLLAYQSRNFDDKVLGDILPGEFVGEMAYINRELRSATVVADCQSELIEIPMGQVDQILFQKPSWAKALMKTLSRRLKRSNLN